MLDNINNWLQNPKREYAFGLMVFNRFASSEMKRDYGEYLSKGDTDNVTSSDVRFPMLINKVTFIYNLIRLNPQAYANQTANVSENKISLAVKPVDLNGQTHAVVDSKPFDVSVLPEKLKQRHERIRELVPLMAAIHGELKNEGLTDEQRKEKAQELCRYDDERHSHWDAIDAFLRNKDLKPSDQRYDGFSDDPVLRGAQIANRMKRLKENITRSNESAEKYTKQGKETLAQSAIKRVQEYQEQLDKLDAMLNVEKEI